MTAMNSITSFRSFFKDKISTFLNGNRKLIIQFLVTALFIGMAAWFIKHEKTELSNVRGIISGADINWILAGLGLVVFYIFIQSVMYVTSFSSLNIRLNLWDAIILFLKRNFISVFLPAGAVSSLAFFTKDIEKKGITRTQIYFASSIYAFVGILSVVIVAIPAFLFIVAGGNLGAGKWYALAGVILILLVFIFIYYSLLKKRILYTWIIKLFPNAGFFLDDLKNNKINRMQFIYTVLISIVIEFVGIAHVYISMLALHFSPSITSAIMAYIVVVLFLIISPFLRGLGAIEVSMTYVLIQTGFSSVEAISITLLFRFFEFWLPLFGGILSFFLKVERIIIRILPAVLIFFLGVMNIISVLTPAVPERLKILNDYLLIDIVSFSNSFVLVAGLFMLVIAAFMLRGLRSAWWFAIILSIISVFGHITKGIDYEEAAVALFITGSLIATRKEYYVKTDPKLETIGLQTALFSIALVLLYGVLGFYLLDKKHFQIDFNISQSIRYTIQNFLLIGSKDLVPHDSFARDFIYLIKISGFSSLAFLVYASVRPYFFRTAPKEDEISRARTLTRQFGNSPLDYFKTYSDKLIFAPGDVNAYIAYRVSRNFAVVLEDPVAENREAMKKCIISFSKFCYDNGLKDIYYRVPKESLPVYNELSKKSLFLGQEGLVDLNSFSLEGGERKSIRNALKKITEQGYITRIIPPPLSDGLIQKLKAVSEEWLKLTERDEIIFSQGMFTEREIKGQTVITLETREEKIIAFLNIIPDSVKNEGTYDLLRKTADAPNGVMDYMLVELFKYFKTCGFQYVNLGFAPMSGIDDPHNFPERSMKFAYEKIRSFSHYKGQREYKEKFNPQWHDKFLVYSYDYDLLQVPAVLSRVIKP
ncbi:MAG: phosphatidylglycerol lysyltransferase domain-containing protein [Bacteroidia bacterium]|nr:phosphatidylglycerol lysyltransferase domain-containing protein [Bacteroidia bacterium]